jgi:hypothetical protein
MTTIKTTPLEPTGTKLTKEIYEQANQIWIKEGGSIETILKTRFNVVDFNPYAHYYGYGRPID